MERIHPSCSKCRCGGHSSLLPNKQSAISTWADFQTTLRGCPTSALKAKQGHGGLHSVNWTPSKHSPGIDAAPVSHSFFEWKHKEEKLKHARWYFLMTLKTVSFPLIKKKFLQHKAIPNLQRFQEIPWASDWKGWEGWLDDKAMFSPGSYEHLLRRNAFTHESSDKFLSIHFNLVSPKVIQSKDGVNLALY